MNPEDLARARSVFDAVLEAPRAERSDILRERCGDDAGLRTLVEDLLAEHDRGLGTFLEPPVPVENPSGKKIALPDPVPARLGSYEISERIGAGGMGEVYRAFDVSLRREVAIKVLRAGPDGDGRVSARFRREASLLASFSHPNVAVIYSYETDRGFRFFAMELVRGDPLDAVLAAGVLPAEKAIRIARSVCGALEAAHGHGIVHRDLKPSNVMVTPHGIVKVLDFGIAKRWSTEASEVSALTEKGTILGTPGYLSPEQVLGEPVDARSDIWSFGCLLFELLAGERAFAGRTPYDRIAAVLKTEPDWKALPTDLPGPLADLIRSCLVKDPARRLDAISTASRVLAGRSAPLPPP